MESELDAAINELKDTDRRVIIARFFEKQPLKAIGEMLDVTDRAAHMRISRAVDRLRERMGARGFAIPAAALSVGLVESTKAAPALTAVQVARAAIPPSAPGIWQAISQLPFAAKATALMIVAVAGFLMLRDPQGQLLSTIAPQPRMDSKSDKFSSRSGTAAIAKRRFESVTSTSHERPVVPAGTKLHTISVEFVDSDTGRFLPNFRFRRYWIEGSQKLSGIVQADDQGRWAMTRPEEHFNWFAISSHTPGRVDRKIEWTTTNGITPLSNFVFLAERAAKISGFVVDEDGNPIRKKRVVAMQPTSTNFGQNNSATTNEDGYWEIDSLSPKALSNYAFCVHSLREYLCSAPAYLSDAVTRSNLLTGNHVFVLRKGLTLDVRVLGDGGTPLSRVDVLRYEAVTDDHIFHAGARPLQKPREDGTFQVGPLLDGRNLLSFRKKGYAFQRVLMDVSSNSPPMEIVLERGRTVRIDLIDAAANPVRGAIVSSTEPPHTQQKWFYSAETPSVVPGSWHYGRTSLDGVVMLTNVPSVPVTLTARLYGYGTNTFVISNNVDHAEIVLRKHQAEE